MRQPAKDGKVPLKAYGAVWGDGTPIKKVEVQLDKSLWPKRRSIPNRWRNTAGVSFRSTWEPSSRASIPSFREPSTPTAAYSQPQDDEIALKKTYWEAYEQWPRHDPCGCVSNLHGEGSHYRVGLRLSNDGNQADMNHLTRLRLATIIGYKGPLIFIRSFPCPAPGPNRTH